MELFKQLTKQENNDTYQLLIISDPRVQRGQVVQAGTPLAVKVPTYGDNIKWFFTYQMGFMYWRYFMWNFAGKQNDMQGFGNKQRWKLDHRNLIY